MSFFIKAIASLIGTGVFGSTAYYVFDSMIPKTYGAIQIWEGKPLVKEQKLFVGNYADNLRKIRDEIPEAGIQESDSIPDGTEKLMRWCEKEFNKEMLDNLDYQKQKKIDKYCYGNVETVRGKLSAAGIVDWLDSRTDSNKDDNKFKYLVAIYASVSEFKTWTSVEDNGKPSTEYLKLKKKCEEELNKKLSEAEGVNYKYLNWWCTNVTPLTIEERIKEQKPGWKKPTDWKKVFKKWVYTEEILKSIKGTYKNANERINYKTLNETSGSTSIEPTKRYCETGLAKKIYEDNVYKSEYKNIMSVCQEI